MLEDIGRALPGGGTPVQIALQTKSGGGFFLGGAHVSRKHNADDVTTQQAGCIRFKDENGYLGTVPRPAASQNTLVYYCIFPFLRMPLERERTNNRRVCSTPAGSNVSQYANSAAANC